MHAFEMQLLNSFVECTYAAVKYISVAKAFMFRQYVLGAGPMLFAEPWVHVLKMGSRSKFTTIFVNLKDLHTMDFFFRLVTSFYKRYFHPCRGPSGQCQGHYIRNNEYDQEVPHS